MRIRPLFIIVSLLAAVPAGAQQRAATGGDTVLKGSTIEVLQSYKPKVKQSPKPEWIPQLPPLDTSRPTFSYDVPQQTLYYTYNSLPLRPLALGKTEQERPFPNYIKLGAGNLSTLFLDAGVGQAYGEDYETALHLHHLSQKGAIVGQKTVQSGIELEGTKHMDTHDLHATIAGERNAYGYYGYDHSLHVYPDDSVKQSYTSISAMVDIANKLDSGDKLSYHPSLKVSYYGARYNTSEFTTLVDVPVGYKLTDELGLQLNVSGALTHYRSGSIGVNNNYIQAAPGVSVHSGQFGGHALAGFALGKGGSGYFLPDIMASYTIPGAKHILSAGLHSMLRQNTYEQLTTENPYLASLYNVLQTRSSEAFADLQGSGGDHLAYSARVSWWNYKDLATFLNDLGDQKAFYVRYQDVQAISFQLAARYRVANIWSVGLSGSYYSFYQKTDAYVWHEPSLRLKGDVMVSPVPKLAVGAYIYMLSGMHARDAALANITLKPATDIGLSAEYQFISRLSAFIQVNNLLNNKYQRWLGYEVYGFNIYGGLRLKF